MTTKNDIRTLLSQPVYDSGGKKIGKAQQVFYDDVTGRPEWVTVKTGMLGHSESFIPVSGAVQSEGHLEVAYSKDKIKDAPSVELDDRGHLSMKEENRLFDFYGLKGSAAAAPQTQRTGESAADDQEQARRQASAGTAGTAAAAGTSAGAMDRRGGMDTQAAETEATTARQDARPQTRPAADLAGRPDDGAAGVETMTLSEEELRVRVERRESGRARLHKYVETEQQQRSIPVRHEEVRLIREPITDENRGDEPANPELSESERVVILHEEKPVVEKTVRARERVRIAIEEKTEQQTVQGTVRREHIRVEDGAGEDQSR